MADSSEKATKKVKRKHRAQKGDVEMESLDQDAVPPSRLPAAQASKPWSWIPVSPDASSNKNVIFSHDGTYFFVPSACSIEIHSTSTLLVVSTLSSTRTQSSESSSVSARPGHHTQAVTSILLNPDNPLQLYSASLDGTIKIWDWLEGTLLKTLDYGFPIWHMSAHTTLPDTIFVHADVSKTPQRLMTRDKGVDTKASSRVYKVSLKPRQAGTSKAAAIIPVGKPVSRITAMAISPNGLWLVATSGTKAHVASTSRPQDGWSKFASTHKLTCLAFHPTQGYFATGDEEGEVRLWYCLNDDQLSFEKLGEEKKAATSLFHWHAHAVQSIAFTPNGSYLLSGGLASVLVMWQVETGHKGFVPRVGAPINGISVVETPDRGQEFLLSLADGDLAMASSNTLSIRSRTGIKLRTPGPSKHPTVLTVHPQRNWLALSSSHPASLQIYDPYTASTITEVEASPSNRVAATDANSILTPSAIVHATFSLPDGRWLATVDVRDATLDNSEITFLKIWSWSREGGQGNYVLNTKIDKPHGRHALNSMAFSPADGKLATAGDDGSVRVWGVKRLSTGKENHGTEEVWVQRTAISYRSHNPRSIAFSPDNSLIAVAYDHSIALFNGSSHTFLQVISNCTPLTQLSSVMFLGKAARYLGLSGGPEGDVLVWDLISSRSVAHIRALPHPTSPTDVLPPSTSRIIQRSDGATIAVVRGQSAQIWDLRTLRPVSEPSSLPFTIKQVVPLYSNNSKDFSAVAISDEGTVLLIGDNVSLPEREGAVERSLSKASSTRLSLFEDVFGRSAFKDLESTVVEPRVEIDPTNFGAAMDLRLLDGPAYLLPPMETLYQSLMDGVLVKPREERGDFVDERVDEDDAMEVDEMGDLAPEVEETLPMVRLVDQGEMDMFVQLFQEHCWVPGPSKQANGHVNGIAKTSSISSSKAKPVPVNGNGNGMYHRSATSPASSDINPAKKHKAAKGGVSASGQSKTQTIPSVKPLLNGVNGTSANVTPSPSPSPQVGQKRKARKDVGAGGSG